MTALPNEKELIIKLSQGSQDAFRSLYMHYHPKIKYYITGFVKESEVSRDLSQEVFLKLWKYREQLTQVNVLGSYLFVLTKNLIYDHFRCKQLPLVDLMEIENYHNADYHTPYEQLLATELEAEIRATVKQMPLQRRTIFLMSRKQGMTNTEIAEQLQITKKTVENHLNIALNELRRVIKLILLMFFT